MNSAPDFKTRYAAILDVYGITPSELADLLQEPIAKFYKYRDGSAEPRDKLLRKMLEKMPDLSRDYLYEGRGPVRLQRQTVAATSATDDGIDWKGRFEALETKYTTLADDYRTLMGKYEKVLERLMRKLDPSFNQSDSQLTALPVMRRLIDMGRHDSPLTECKVLAHPATVERGFVRMLNSLAPVAEQA